MRAALLALGLLLACAAPAWAAGTFVQAGVTNCSASSAAALAVNPTNANFVLGIQRNTTTLGAATMLDSNSVSYAAIGSGSGGVTSAFLGSWGQAVAGSPTKNYTMSVNNRNCLFELSGTTGTATATVTSAASTGTTLTATDAGVSAGDMVIAYGFDVTNGSTALTTNNGALTSDQASGFDRTGHMFATATASTTVTLATTAADNAALIIVRFTCAGGCVAAGGSAPKCGPYPYPCIFQPSYYKGPSIMELLCA